MLNKEQTVDTPAVEEAVLKSEHSAESYSSFRQYTKAVFVLATSTAAYFVAKSTGWLPLSWRAGNKTAPDPKALAGQIQLSSENAVVSAAAMTTMHAMPAIPLTTTGQTESFIQFREHDLPYNAPKKVNSKKTNRARLSDVDTDFMVSTYTVSTQLSPSIAVLADGNFIVTWSSNGQDGSFAGIYAQRFNASGIALGSEFKVNTYTISDQEFSSVAALSNGGFVVTWRSSNDQDGSGFGIYGQRYDAQGLALGSEFRVNTYTTNFQSQPSVAGLSNGDFVVAWESNGQDGDSYGIYAQQYDVSGGVVGSEFRVNTATANSQLSPAVASLPNGGYVVTWSSNGASSGIYGQRYNATGIAVGSQFQINTYTGSQSQPSVAGFSSGGFVVAWQSLDQDGDSYGIYGQRYDATGTKLGTEFKVNTYTTDSQHDVSVAVFPDDSYIMAWASNGQNNGDNALYTQRYDASGAPFGGESMVSNLVVSNTAAIAALQNMRPVAVWQSNHIFGKIISLLPSFPPKILLGVAGSINYPESSSPLVLDATLTVSDTDSVNLQNATVSIGANFVAGQDVLNFVNQNGISGSYDSLTGILTLTGSSSVANYQAALRSVTYQNLSDNPSTAARSILMVVSDGTLTSSVVALTVNVTTINDAPVLSSVANAVTYVENASPLVLDATLTVSDVDNVNLQGATVSISANFVAGQDILNFVNQNGIVGSYDSLTGVLTLTGSSSVTNYQAALRSVTYQNLSENPTAVARSISMTVSDGALISNSIVRTVNVTAISDAPVLSSTASAVTYIENASPLVLDATLTVSDADSVNLQGATVSISANFVPGQDILNFVNQNGISGSYDNGTGILTLTGSSSVANYQAALRSVTYQNLSDNPATAARSIAMTVSDGVLISNAIVRAVNVNAINDAPVLSSTANAVTYIENASPLVLDATLTVSDVDSVNLQGATVSISANFVAGQDVLNFVNQNGIVGSYDSLTGILTLTGSSSVANYQGALRSVTYQNLSENPNTTARSISMTVSDGALISNAIVRTVNVTAIDDAPVLSSTANAVTYIENASPLVLDATLAISDLDNANLQGATVSISANFVAGQDVLNFVNQNGISGSYDSGTGILTLTGSSSVANYQAALRSVTYQNLSDNPTTAARSIVMTVSDGALISNAIVRTVNVNAINDLPILVNNAMTITEGQTLVIGSSVLRASDPDNTPIQLTFTVSDVLNGQFEVASNPGVAITSFTQQQISDSQIRFVHDGGEFAPSYLVSVSDGLGATTPINATIHFTNVNETPALNSIANTVTYIENASPLVLDATLTVSDIDSANLQSATVSISANFVAGQDILNFVNQNGIVGSYDSLTGVLTLTGSSSVANYQAALRSVTYQNLSDNPATAARSIAMTVSDGALTSNAIVRTVNVSAINDAPVLSSTANAVTYIENASPLALDATLTVSDADSVNLQGATVSISANFVAGQDVLNFVNQNGISGSYDNGTGILTLTGSSSVANYQAALRSVTYQNLSDNPATAARSISMTVSDGALISNTMVRTVNVNAINDAPVLSSTANAVTYIENTSPLVLDATLAISDVDNVNLQGATVSISANFVAGQDVLNFVNQNGISGSYNSLTGMLTLTGSSSVANYQAALRSVTYQNLSENPNTTARSISMTVSDGALISNAMVRTVNVNAINDAPVLSSTANAVTYIENASPLVLDATLAISDLDNANLQGATVSISANFVAGQDVLNFVNQNGISGSYNSLTGMLTLTGSSSVANYQAALRSVTYQNLSDNPNTAARSISMTVSDGALISNAIVRTVNVNAINDAMVLEINRLSISEGETITLTSAMLNAGDPDNPSSELVYTLSNIQHGYFELVSNAGNAITTFTQQQINNGQVRFVHDGGEVAPSYLVSISDGQANTTPVAATITFIPVNDAPILSSSGSSVSFSENGDAVLIDGSLVISDVDSALLQNARVSITNLQPGDELLLTNQRDILGSYNSQTGVLTLTGSGSTANYQTALRNVAYRSTSDNPSIIPRSISMVVNDGKADSLALIKTVNIIAVNDAPLLTDVAGALSYTGTREVVTVSSTLVLSDLDNDVLQGATVSIISNFNTKEDALIFISQNGITGAYNAATGILVLSGASSVANYQTALRSVAYQNSAESPDRSKRTIAFSIYDGVTWGTTIQREITFTALSTSATASSQSIWEEAKNRLTIGAPTVVGGLAAGAFGIWAYRRHVDKTWQKSPQYAVHNYLRKLLKLSLGTVEEARGKGYLSTVFELLGRMLNQYREERESDKVYYERLGALVKSFSPKGEDVQRYGNALAQAIRTCIDFQRLCDATPQSDRPLVFRTRYFQDCCPNPTPFFVSYKFDADLFTEGLIAEIAERARGLLTHARADSIEMITINSPQSSSSSNSYPFFEQQQRAGDQNVMSVRVKVIEEEGQEGALSQQQTPNAF